MRGPKLFLTQLKKHCENTLENKWKYAKIK